MLTNEDLLVTDVAQKRFLSLVNLYIEVKNIQENDELLTLLMHTFNDEGQKYSETRNQYFDTIKKINELMVQDEGGEKKSDEANEGDDRQDELNNLELIQNENDKTLKSTEHYITVLDALELTLEKKLREFISSKNKKSNTDKKILNIIYCRECIRLYNEKSKSSVEIDKDALQVLDSLRDNSKMVAEIKTDQIISCIKSVQKSLINAMIDRLQHFSGTSEEVSEFLKELTKTQEELKKNQYLKFDSIKEKISVFAVIFDKIDNLKVNDYPIASQGMPSEYIESKNMPPEVGSANIKKKVTRPSTRKKIRKKGPRLKQVLPDSQIEISTNNSQTEIDKRKEILNENYFQELGIDENSFNELGDFEMQMQKILDMQETESKIIDEMNIKKKRNESYLQELIEANLFNENFNEIYQEIIAIQEKKYENLEDLKNNLMEFNIKSKLFVQAVDSAIEYNNANCKIIAQAVHQRSNEIDKLIEELIKKLTSSGKVGTSFKFTLIQSDIEKQKEIKEQYTNEAKDNPKNFKVLLKARRKLKYILLSLNQIQEKLDFEEDDQLQESERKLQEEERKRMVKEQEKQIEQETNEKDKEIVSEIENAKNKIFNLKNHLKQQNIHDLKLNELILKFELDLQEKKLHISEYHKQYKIIEDKANVIYMSKSFIEEIGLSKNEIEKKFKKGIDENVIIQIDKINISYSYWQGVKDKIQNDLTEIAHINTPEEFILKLDNIQNMMYEAVNNEINIYKSKTNKDVVNPILRNNFFIVTLPRSHISNLYKNVIKAGSFIMELTRERNELEKKETNNNIIKLNDYLKAFHMSYLIGGLVLDTDMETQLKKELKQPKQEFNGLFNRVWDEPAVAIEVLKEQPKLKEKFFRNYLVCQATMPELKIPDNNDYFKTECMRYKAQDFIQSKQGFFQSLFQTKKNRDKLQETKVAIINASDEQEIIDKLDDLQAKYDHDPKSGIYRLTNFLRSIFRIKVEKKETKLYKEIDNLKKSGPFLSHIK